MKSLKGFFKSIERNDYVIPQSKDVALYVHIVLFVCVSFCSYNIISRAFFQNGLHNIQPPKDLIEEDISLKPVDTSIIYSRNIFNIDGVIPDYDLNRVNTGLCPVNPAKSNIDYTLVGILFGGSSDTSTVVLESTKNKSILILKNGDDIPLSGRVSAIFARKIYIKMDKCPEYLALDDFKLPPSRVRIGETGTGSSYSEKGFERLGTTSTVTRQWVNDILTNKLSQVLEDAFAQPNIVNGKVQGFTVSQITPNSVYDKLGIKNGDVVTSINGIPLNDAARAIQTLNSMKNEPNLEMQVIRNGQPVTFKVSIQQ